MSPSAVRQQGAVIGGRFQVVRLLETGSEGSVFEATHLTLRTQVAVKVVNGPLTPQVEQRLTREAQAAAQIRHPNVVAVSDFGPEDGGFFLASELLVGVLVEGALSRAWAPEEVQSLMRQGCAALTAVHAAGILHRRISPRSLFVVPHADGGFTLKLVDFGAARLPDPHGAQKATLGLLVLDGVDYWSPEQVLGGEVVAETDLYSLAAVAYRLLTGQAMVANGAVGRMLVDVAANVVLPPSTVRPELGKAYDSFFAKALGKEPSDRYPTPAALDQAFERAFRGAIEPSRSAAKGTVVGFDSFVGGVAASELRDAVAQAKANANAARDSVPVLPFPWKIVAGIGLGVLALGGVLWATRVSEAPRTKAASGASASGSVSAPGSASVASSASAAPVAPIASAVPAATASTPPKTTIRGVPATKTPPKHKTAPTGG